MAIFANATLNKKFVKDYKLPISVYTSPYFEYFLDLYDSTLDTKAKYNEFLEKVENESNADYVQLYRKFFETVVDHVKSKESYQEFIGMDFKKYSERFRPKNTLTTLLTPANSGKKYISIDMEKANFHAFKTFNMDLVEGKETYEEWIETFEHGELFSDVKSIRQVIFGNLNPKRQQSIEGFYMSELTKVMDEFGLFETTPLIVLGSDEVVVEYSEETYRKLNEALTEFYNRDDHKFKFRLDVFEVEKYTPYTEFGYQKKFEDGTVEFKNVSKLFYPQMLKHYLGQEVEPNDLMFVNDQGYLCKLQETVVDKYAKKSR